VVIYVFLDCNHAWISVKKIIFYILLVLFVSLSFEYDYWIWSFSVTGSGVFLVEYSFGFLFSEAVTDFIPCCFSLDGALGVPAPSLIFYIAAEGSALAVSYFSACNSISVPRVASLLLDFHCQPKPRCTARTCATLNFRLESLGPSDLACRLLP
jgi:hypothetical protein